MPKYHVNIHGAPAVCDAEIKCRVQGALVEEDGTVEHFEGEIEGAKGWAEEKNAQRYSTLPTNKKVEEVDKEATRDSIDSFLEDMPFTDVIDVSETDDGFEAEVRVGGQYFSIDFEDGDDEEEIKSKVISRLEDFDADESFTEYEASGAESLRTFYETEEQVKQSLSEIKGDSESDYESLNDKVEEKVEENNSIDPTSSELPNDKEYDNEDIEEMIEDYSLNHNNSEVFDQDGEQFIVVEAPNHATFQVEHSAENSGNTVGDVRKSLLRMEEFDADEEFDELWSNGFGAHNGISATDFYTGLKADEQYFKDRARDIREDIENR